MRSSGEAPKIVQIETRYVETDANNFRDVVQSLTGKNSSTAWIGRNNNDNNNADAASSSSMANSGNNSSQIKTAGTAISTKKPQEEQDAAATSYNSSGSTKEGDLVVPISMLTNNMPFKDFDRLLLEMPSAEGIEGLPWF